jgi:hypothetical protein
MQLLQVIHLVGLAIGVLWTVVVPSVLVGSSALHIAIRTGAIAWPPPNTTFLSWWGRSSRAGHRKLQQVRHAYSCGNV